MVRRTFLLRTRDSFGDAGAMKTASGFHLIAPDDLHWRPSNLMRIPNADFLERTGSEKMGAQLWRLPSGSANTLHKHIRSEEFYLVLEGTGRMRVARVDWNSDENPADAKTTGVPIEWETLTVPRHGGVWLIVGAAEELEFLQGLQSPMDLSLIYPTDPTQLPPELGDVEWPPGL